MNAQQAGAGVAVVLAIGVGLWIWKRGLGGVAQDVTAGAVKVAGGAAVGVVKGGASVIGIPDTDAAKCRAAIAAGDYWDASFYCSAGEFVAGGGTAFYQWFRPPERTQ